MSNIVNIIKPNINKLIEIILIYKIPFLNIITFLVFPYTLTGIINVLGFKAAGIVSGSFGSWFMSLYGGTINSGSLISILQSIGAVGLSKIGIIFTGTIGTITSNKFLKYYKK